MTGHDDGKDSGEGDAIKVFVRIRPPDSYDTDIGQVLALKVLDETSLVMNSKPESRVFTFDKVADVTSTQESLFNVIGRPIIECCVSGYNGTIFAYGQTGSGKTHTMLGPCEDADNFQHELRGIIPRSFENLFNNVANEQEMNKGKEFLLKCSFLEIYREDVFDLLEPSNRGLHLRENMKKGVFVEGLVENAVTSAVEAYQVLNSGWINRRVASTSMNRESSRSHAVFTITIESKEKKDGVQSLRVSQLNLVDLAGSERQKDSNAVGKRLKEAGSINKSLSVLGNVINSLVHISHGKTRHIPYRDSKLTFLLRDSLGGNAKTHIIACVHPSSKCFGESLSTLQFAGRAKMIKNKAVINEDSHGNVLALQVEIKKLKEMLQQYASGTIKMEPSTSGIKQEGDNTSSVSDSEWKERFIQSMLLRENCAQEKMVKTSFLTLVDLPDGKADTIVPAIKTLMTDRQLPIQKMMGFGSDGASVMVGRKNGVATQLKSQNPEMVNVHCIAHRLALAAAQASDNIPYLQKFKDILRQLFYYYKNSAVRMSGLKEIELILGTPSIKLKEVADTRWLSHESAVTAIRRCLPALILSLEREASERCDATAAGLALFVKNPLFICTISMLSDILPHLNRLSKIFQKTTVDLSLIDSMVSATQMSLQHLLNQHGEHMTKLPDLFQQLEEYGVKQDSTVVDKFKDKTYQQYINNVIENLHNRFPDTALLDAFSVFDPDLICKEDPATNEYIHFQKLQIFEEKLIKLRDQCNKKDACLQSTKMIVKFRENRISQLESALKKNGFESDDKDKYAEDLKAEINLLQEQVKQHPMVAKYSMEIQALKSQLKHERTQNENTNRNKADLLMELDGKYKELTQDKKIFTPAQTPKEENVATATVEKYKSQVNNLQEEVAKLKQQLTENADAAEKEKVELISEIESLKSTVKDLSTSLKTQKLTNKIERENMNDMHLQTITQITTPKKAAYTLRNRVIAAPSTGSNTPSLNDSIPFEKDEDIFDENQPDFMMEQAHTALMDEMKILQDKNNSLTERIAEFETEAIQLRQHISKVDHQNGQLNEILDRERADLASRAEASEKQVIELQKQLLQSQEEARMNKEEARDYNVMMTSNEKQLDDLKKEHKLTKEENEKNLNTLETKLVQLAAELDNITKNLETTLETKESLQEEVDTLQVEKIFKDSLISELEETLRNEKSKMSDLLRENQTLLHESQQERSTMSDQLREEERQNEANNQTISNLQRELQNLEQTASTQQKQLAQNTEVINDYLDKIKDLKTSLFEKNFTLETEQEKTKSLEESVQSLVSEIRNVKSQMLNLEEEKKKMEEDHQTELSNVNEQVDCLTKNFNELEEEHRKVQKSKTDLEKQFETLKDEKEALNTLIKENKVIYENEVTDLKQQVVVAERRLIDKESESEEVFGKLIEELTSKNDRLKENNSDLCQSIKELQESKEEKNRENEELKNKLKAIESLSEGFRNQKQCLEYEMQNKRDTLDKLSVESMVKEEQIRGLESDYEMIKEESVNIKAENEMLQLRFSEIDKEMNEVNERNKVLLEENAKLVGHQNLKQKIHYTAKLKDENNFLREQLSKHQQEIMKLKSGTPTKKENRTPLKQWNEKPWEETEESL